jgi:mRNA interferase MazF
MRKDFKRWHDNKNSIDLIEKRPFFHEKEIWWCTLGVNIGFEQDGGGEDYLRPVIIYKKFNNEIFWAIPLTRTDKKTKYYFQLTKENDSSISTAILSQIRLVDARRLSHKFEIGVSDEDFVSITKKFKALLP